MDTVTTPRYPAKMRLIKDVVTPLYTIKCGSIFHFETIRAQYKHSHNDVGLIRYDPNMVIGQPEWFEPVFAWTHEQILNLNIYPFGMSGGANITIKQYLKDSLILLLQRGENGTYIDTKSRIYGAFAKNKIILEWANDDYQRINKGDFLRADTLINELIDKIWT